MKSYTKIKRASLLPLNNQRGASGLEFTLVFPLLLMVTFGIIEFGALMFDKAIVTNAAREATRAVIVYDYDGTDPACSDLTTIRTNTQNVVNRWMRNNFGGGNLFLINFDTETPNITVDPPELVNGEYVLPVTVGYRFHFILIDIIINLLFNGAWSDGIDLDAEVKMRGEDQRLLRYFVENGCT